MAKQNKIIDQDIFSLLENGSDNYYTHVNMTGKKGKYILSYNNIDSFWKKYWETISKSISNEKYIIGLAEKPQRFMPVIADIDIKVKSHNDKGELIYSKEKNLYSDKVILQFVQVYQGILKILVKDITKDDLDCVILTKPPYYKKYGTNTYTKNGFHLHFPKIFLDKEDQMIFLLPKVKHAMESMYKDILSDIGIEDSSKLIDSNIYKMCFLLYGGVKEKGMYPYLLSGIVDSELKKKDIKKSLIGYSLYDQDGEEEKIDKSNLNENIPRILSIIPYGRKYKTIKIDPQLKTVRAPKPKKKKKEYEEQKYSEKLEWAKSLVGILSPDRADDYISWMQVGWALYNVSEGSDDGLVVWKRFSSISEKYCEEKCDYEWDRMEVRDITIGSLKYWALKDNPNHYSELLKNKSADYIKDHLTGSIFQGDMVKVVHQLYEGQFVCASISNQKKSWFYFNNHRWENIDCGVELWKKISDEVLYIVNSTKMRETKKMQDCQDELKVQMYAKRVKLLEKLAGKMTCGTYKDRLLKDAAYMFYDKYFLEKLDSNPYIIPFQNGIYDLRNNIFREGKPEDYVSKTLPLNYNEYSETDTRVEDVEDFFRKVFPDYDLRQYFLAHLSEIFVGNNKKKIVYMWTGHGDNGKSVTQTLIENMMGKYAIKMPTTILTAKKPNVGAACVELARAGNGVRWAVLEEPNEDERINIGILKNLSGNDTFFARGLYSDGADIKPMFKLIFICLSADTEITLSSGHSVSIGNMIEKGSLTPVLGYSQKRGEYHSINYNCLLEKGVQECISLKFQDNTIVKCTPNHKFLCDNDEWIEANNLRGRKIISGPRGTNIDSVIHNYNIGEYSNSWITLYNDKKIPFDRIDTVFFAMAYARFIGNLLYTNGEKYVWQVDREQVRKDILLINDIGDIDIENDIIKNNEIIEKIAERVDISNWHDYMLVELISTYLGKMNVVINEWSIKISTDREGTLLKEIAMYIRRESNIPVISNNNEIQILNVEKYRKKYGFRYNSYLNYKLDIVCRFISKGTGNLRDFEREIGFVENTLNPISLRVVEIKNISSTSVYDINVQEGYSNFLANGICSHNCNRLPDINSSDKATWNRIRVIPFESTFTRNPPEDIEEQNRQKIFPMDEDFSSKIPDMLEPLAWYLLNFRKNIKKEIFEPEKVMIATKEYREENDYISIFIDENFSQEEDSTISINEVYSLYKAWHRDNMAGYCFNKKKIQQQMSRIWGPVSSPGSYWKGWKIITAEENMNIQKIDPNNLVKYEEENYAEYDNSIPM